MLEGPWAQSSNHFPFLLQLLPWVTVFIPMLCIVCFIYHLFVFVHFYFYGPLFLSSRVIYLFDLPVVCWLDISNLTCWKLNMCYFPQFTPSPVFSVSGNDHYSLGSLQKNRSLLWSFSWSYNLSTGLIGSTFKLCPYFECFSLLSQPYLLYLASCYSI